MIRYAIGAAILVAIFGSGYWAGGRMQVAKYDRALLAAQEQADREAMKLRVMTDAWNKEREVRRDLEGELNDAARQDPDAARPAFGVDSVRRLNQIR